MLGVPGAHAVTAIRRPHQYVPRVFTLPDGRGHVHILIQLKDLFPVEHFCGQTFLGLLLSLSASFGPSTLSSPMLLSTSVFFLGFQHRLFQAMTTATC